MTYIFLHIYAFSYFDNSALERTLLLPNTVSPAVYVNIFRWERLLFFFFKGGGILMEDHVSQTA